MAQNQGDFDFPWGRWLMYAFLGIVGVLAIVIVFANIGRDVEANSTTAPPILPNDGEQYEWSYETSDYTTTPGLVTLKGDEPIGFPTETWLDGDQIARTVSGESFEWQVEASPVVPVPVYEVDQTDSCSGLSSILQEWANAVGEAPNNARGIEASVFAQYTADKMVAEGCELPDT